MRCGRSWAEGSQLPTPATLFILKGCRARWRPLDEVVPRRPQGTRGVLAIPRRSRSDRPLALAADVRRRATGPSSACLSPARRMVRQSCSRNRFRVPLECQCARRQGRSTALGDPRRGCFYRVEGPLMRRLRVGVADHLLRQIACRQSLWPGWRRPRREHRRILSAGRRCLEARSQSGIGAPSGSIKDQQAPFTSGWYAAPRLRSASLA